MDPDFGIDKATGKWTEGYAGCKMSRFSNRANKENPIARWLIAIHDVTRKPIYRERAEKWWQSMKARMRKREGGKYFVWNYGEGRIQRVGVLQEWLSCDSPPEESVGIVPFLRLVEIQSVEPALPRFPPAHGRTESCQNRGGTTHAEVPQQAGNQERSAPMGSPQVGLWDRFKKPGRHLAEDDLPAIRDSQHTIARNLSAARNQGQFARIAIVDIGRANTRQH